MYQALYNKWRPKTLDDVVGQEHVTETLKRQIVSGRLSHAYLFVGTRGTGKTSCAKILSRAINCLDPQDGNPCNKCSACLGIENGSIMDVQELDAASNNGVDNVRALRDDAEYTPIDVRKRVYIIDEVHMLSIAAFNALLKILEEPPEHLIFILATTEIHKVPATILSRCQRFTFKRILPEKVAEQLNFIAGREGITLTNDAAALLARLADGSLRDAISLFDQCASDATVDYDRVLSAIGLAGSSEITGIFSAIAENNTATALELLDKLYIGGKVMASVLEQLTSLARDVLITALIPKGGAGLLSGGFDNAALESYSKQFTTGQLQSMLGILRETVRDFSKSSGGKLEAELCLIRLCDSRLNTDISALLSRISVLEDKLEGGMLSAAPPAPAANRFVPPARQPHEPESAETTLPAEPTPVVTQTPALQASAAPGTGTAGDIWARLLNLIKSDIGPLSASLNDQITPTLEGNTLILSSKTPFGSNMLSKPEVSAAIREAMPQAAGSNLTFRIVQDNASAGGTADKLDALSRFSNVKIE